MLSKSFGQQILRSVFRINPGEGFRAGLMLIYSIATVGGVVITGKLLSRALFLSVLPPSAVPFKFILPPIFLAPVILIYTRVAGRIRRDRSILDMRTRGYPLSIETHRLRKALQKEFQTAYALEVLRSDIGADITDLLLHETIGRRTKQAVDGILIVEGEIAIKVDGEERAIRTKGDILGELAVLSEQPRMADCVAQTDIIALRIGKVDFWELMSERPEITIGIMKVLVDRYL